MRGVESTPIRFLAITIALVFVGGIVALTNQGDAGSSAQPNATNTASALPTSFARSGIRCPPGPRIAIPKWFPDDLSLPDGAYALDIALPKVSNYNRVALAVPSSLRDFAKHIATRWPKQGWSFTRAEIEFIDAEAQVTNADRSEAAAFVARAVCDDTYIQMYLTYGSVT
jgi:hypothetical protein